MEIQIIHETILENPDSFEEVEIWMDLYLASGKDTYDTPGYTDIQIKDWGVIDENSKPVYTNIQPNWVTEKMLDREAEIAFGKYTDMMDENPFADDRDI